MKRLLAALFLAAGLSGVASADVTFVVQSDAAASVPVEQKVVEIHMSATPAATESETKLKRGKISTMPLIRRGTCSGEFVSDDGDILTAKHCVEDFDTFEVQTFDRRLYYATVVASSTAHDLALIHIDRRDTPYFELADSVQRGEKISILGSPLGITDTLSTGVIARLDGDVTFLDCSALPGNSGGPVFDTDQKLVGVLNAGMIVMFGVTHLNMAQGLDAVYFFLKEVEEKRNGRR